MRRIALISDVHGNAAALEAVLADVSLSEIAETYCLGDLVGYGPDPAGVVDLVRARAIPTVRGNYDDGIGNRRGGCGCYYPSDEARRDGDASYAFTEPAIDDVRAEWLAALPDSIHLEADGLHILLAHGSPRKINEYLTLDRSDEQLARLAHVARADIVCVGHTHIGYHRVVQGDAGDAIHYVNAGSVGKPKDGDPRAGWMELVVGTEAEAKSAAPADDAIGVSTLPGVWVGTNMHRVAYDVAGVQRAMRAAGLPEGLVRALESA